MLQVARLAPKSLGDATGLVGEYLRSQLTPSGGFADRAGGASLVDRGCPSSRLAAAASGAAAWAMAQMNLLCGVGFMKLVYTRRLTPVRLAASIAFL